MEQDFPVWLAFLFPVFFVAMWVLVSRIISWMGWSAFVARFAFDRQVPPDATRYGSQSLMIGDKLFRAASYNNCMNIWVDQRGLYLRPQLIFRLFHPLIHIRWDQVVQAEVRTGFLKGGTRLSFKADVPVITMRGRSGQAVAERWQASGAGKAA